MARLLLFAALACVHTWPLASDPGVWSRNDNADAMLNEWILAWVARTLPTQPWHLFNANIFYPEPNTLAFSESLIVQGAMGIPLYWLGASPVLMMNLLILLGLALTGWSMSMVIERWTGSARAGVLAGCVMAFNTSVLTRMGHVQAMHVEFLPLALLAFDELLRSPTTGSALRLGVWFALQALCSGYLLMITLVALTASAVVRCREWLGARSWLVGRHVLVATAAFGVVTGPFLWPYYVAKTAQGLARPLDEVALYSAHLADYVTTTGRLHYGAWSHAFYRGADSFFPGVVAVILATAALSAAPIRRDPRAHMLIAFGLVGFALSFGPSFPLYPWIHAHVPLFEGLRGAARFGYLPVIAVSGLAAFGLAGIERRMQASGMRWTSALIIALIALANLEMLRAPMSYTRFEGIPPIYRVLADEPGAIVAEFPLPSPRTVAINGRYVLASTEHWRPLVNGYSGFVPESYAKNWGALNSFPDAEAVDTLRRLGVTHVVVHLEERPELSAVLNNHPDLEPVVSARAIRIYRVRARTVP